MSKQTDLINIPDAITVDGSNNVGIGASPSSSSTVKIQNTNDNSHNTLDLFNDNGNRTFTFQQDSTGNAKVILQKNDGTNAVRLDANLGGILFGTDTAAANALNDYEEGDINIANLTFTGSGSATTNTNYQTLRYTKVGQVVSITGNIYLASVTSQNGALKIPLPFTSGTGEKHRTASGTANASSNTPTFIKVDAGSSFGTLITSSGFSTLTISAGQTYLVQLTYNTA
jgi:hypothetical protein